MPTGFRGHARFAAENMPTPSRGHGTLTCQRAIDGPLRNSRQPDVMNHWETPNRVQTVNRKLTGDKITLPAYSVSAIACGRR